MVLNKEQIQNTANLIEMRDDNNLHAVSYDLTVEKIILPNNDDSERSSYALNPGETVFISSKENIKLPNDMVAFVSLRNSCIRQGLSLDAPVYQPGHHTKVFARITNVSNKRISITAGHSVAQVFFAKLNSEAEPYGGKFVDQFSYENIGEFGDEVLPEVEEIKEKVASIKDTEKHIYANVITLMTIFIGVFSLVNLNINFVTSTMDLKSLIVYNLVMLGGISTLVALISVVLPREKHKGRITVVLALVAVLLLVAAFVVFSVVPNP